MYEKRLKLPVLECGGGGIYWGLTVKSAKLALNINYLFDVLPLMEVFALLITAHHLDWMYIQSLLPIIVYTLMFQSVGIQISTFAPNVFHCINLHCVN